MICHATISDQFLRFDIIHGAKIGSIFEICKFFTKKSSRLSQAARNEIPCPFSERRFSVAVFFGSHAGGAFEIAVEGCGFGEAEHIGCFLECLSGTCLNQSFGLRYHVLLHWRDACVP